MSQGTVWLWTAFLALVLWQMTKSERVGRVADKLEPAVTTIGLALGGILVIAALIATGMYKGLDSSLSVPLP